MPVQMAKSVHTDVLNPKRTCETRSNGVFFNPASVAPPALISMCARALGVQAHACAAWSQSATFPLVGIGQGIFGGSERKAGNSKSSSAKPLSANSPAVQPKDSAARAAGVGAS